MRIRVITAAAGFAGAFALGVLAQLAWHNPFATAVVALFAIGVGWLGWQVGLLGRRLASRQRQLSDELKAASNQARAELALARQDLDHLTGTVNAALVQFTAQGASKPGQPTQSTIDDAGRPERLAQPGQTVVANLTSGDAQPDQPRER
ncbi:MAG: hypothetical protein LBR32_09970 [Propionibacteriaceae bacterium]|jgi:hypothetical protein|nr:hypothetical protein [Propionibacteriaceae bacterium]